MRMFFHWFWTPLGPFLRHGLPIMTSAVPRQLQTPVCRKSLPEPVNYRAVGWEIAPQADVLTSIRSATCIRTNICHGVKQLLLWRPYRFRFNACKTQYTHWVKHVPRRQFCYPDVASKHAQRNTNVEFSTSRGANPVTPMAPQCATQTLNPAHPEAPILLPRCCLNVCKT